MDKTQTLDFEGYGPNGRDPFGDDYEGFNPDGIHKLTGSKYNPNGVDINGKNAQGLYSCAEERIYDPAEVIDIEIKEIFD